jgi:hypothetical protein
MTISILSIEPNSFASRIASAKRLPMRVTITIPYSTHQRLIKQSQYEGRSLSNLAAVIIEQALEARSN